MAASKKTAAFGNVSWETALNDARRCGVYVAQRDKRYNPNPAVHPEKRQVKIPGISPLDAMAYGALVS
jgi:hypothetical protein